MAAVAPLGFPLAGGRDGPLSGPEPGAAGGRAPRPRPGSADGVRVAASLSPGRRARPRGSGRKSRRARGAPARGDRAMSDIRHSLLRRDALSAAKEVLYHLDIYFSSQLQSAPLPLVDKGPVELLEEFVYQVPKERGAQPKVRRQGGRRGAALAPSPRPGGGARPGSSAAPAASPGVQSLAPLGAAGDSHASLAFGTPRAPGARTVPGRGVSRESRPGSAPGPPWGRTRAALCS